MGGGGGRAGEWGGWGGGGELKWKKSTAPCLICIDSCGVCVCVCVCVCLCVCVCVHGSIATARVLVEASARVFKSKHKTF